MSASYKWQDPITYMPGKGRSFNPDWYRLYPWLEYSIRKDATFCYPCRLFGTYSVHITRPEKAFTFIGFHDWKHATGQKGILVTHHNSLCHQQAVVAWEQFKATQNHGSVAELLGSSRAQQISKNRHYIRTISEVLLLCSQQEISFRGHDESEGSLNKGNFLQILGLVAKHDPIVGERLFHGSRNAKYTSHMIQNNILAVMASLVRKQICHSVQKACFYSLMVDETKDLSKHEQMSVVVCYVDGETEPALIRERFLTYIPAATLSAESLTKYILKALTRYDLNPQLMVSQGYDGASIMSGHCSGVQQRVREVAPYAVYVHCHAHVLNLVLVDCVKRNSCASEFFSLLQVLYVFLSSSKAHVVFIEKQKELYPGKPTMELKRLSDTRWACRSLTLDVIASTYSSIIASLEHIIDDTDKAKAVEAAGLLHQVHSFKFLACLIIFQRVMNITKALSDQLQSQTTDLVHAAGLISSTTQTLRDFRSDNIWEHTYKYICDVASLNNIEVGIEMNRRRKRQKRLEDSVVLESTGRRNSDDTLNCSQSVKLSIYFPVLDHFLAEMDRRFSTSNLELMKSLDACNPLLKHFLDSSLLSDLASRYGVSQNLLPNECLLAKPALQGEPQTMLEVYHQLS